MHKIFLYIIYSSILYIPYVAYVREYFLTKAYTLILIQFTMTSLETDAKKTGGRNLYLSRKAQGGIHGNLEAATLKVATPIVTLI